MKINTTDRKVITNVAKHGFTFKGDSLFRTYRQATACLNKLVKAGWLVAVPGENGRAPEYRITDAGREAVAYPVSHGIEVQS